MLTRSASPSAEEDGPDFIEGTAESVVGDAGFNSRDAVGLAELCPFADEATAGFEPVGTVGWIALELPDCAVDKTGWFFPSRSKWDAPWLGEASHDEWEVWETWDGVSVPKASFSWDSSVEVDAFTGSFPEEESGAVRDPVK